MNGEELIRADLEARLGFGVKAVDAIPEGHSGFTYLVTAERGNYVLRIPPPGTRIAGPADVVRQGNIMSALHGAGAPTPAIRMMSSDPVIDGRPFILMERVDGTRIEQATKSEKALDIATAAIDVLKRLHALPLDKTGIGDEDPAGLPAEMMRWDVSMQQLYDLYGVDAEEMRWYAAMSLYKYASIFGYNLMLHRKGRRPDPMYEGLTDTIVGMIDEGIGLL